MYKLTVTFLFCFVSFGLAIPGFSGPCSAPVSSLIEPYHTYSFFSTNELSPVYNGTACFSFGADSGVTWFKVNVLEDSTLQASTCSEYTNFDTVVSIYTGDCSSLSCVYYNDDYMCSVNLYSSTVEWSAEANVDYYIAVSGYGTGFGSFELLVSIPYEMPEPTPNCNGYSIPGPYYSPISIEGNTLYGKSLLNPNSCGIEKNSKVTWYNINPKASGYVTITIDSENVYFSVFSSNGCLESDCDASNVPYYPDNRLYAIEDTEYHIGVYSATGNDEDYTITIFQEMSWCPIAAEITFSERIVGESLLISNVNRPEIRTEGMVCSTLSYGPAYWLSVTATSSGTVYLDTCSPLTSFNSVLSAYSGDSMCSSLQCITYDSYASCEYNDNASSIDFPISSGETVHVLLTGYNYSSGNAGLNYSFYPDE